MTTTNSFHLLGMGGVILPKLIPIYWGHYFSFERHKILRVVASLKKLAMSGLGELRKWRSEWIPNWNNISHLGSAAFFEAVLRAHFGKAAIREVWGYIKKDVWINVYQSLSILLSITKGDRFRRFTEVMVLHTSNPWNRARSLWVPSSADGYYRLKACLHNNVHISLMILWKMSLSRIKTTW